MESEGLAEQEPGADAKALPSDLAAERHLLGAAMLSASAAKECIPLVDVADLYSERHRSIYRAIQDALDRNGDSFCLPHVDEAMERAGKYSKPDLDALTACLDGLATASMATCYAEKIRAAAAQRRILLAAKKTEHDARDGGDAAAIAERGIEALEEARKCSQPKAAAYEHISIGITAAFKHLEAITSEEGEKGGLKTGLIDLDEKTGGMRPGELVILGARPSVGKSALALTIALNCIRDGHPVYLESLEMDRLQIMNRLMSQASGVDSTRIRDGDMGESSWSDATRGSAELHGLPLYGCYQPARRIGEIRADLRRARDEHGIELGIVDYLGYIEPDETLKDRRLDMEAISRSLKRTARELGIPLLVLAQLSRKNEDRSRGEREPRISDLRETGMIEADADQIWLLHRAVIEPGVRRKDDDGDPEDPRKAVVIVGKNRNGATGRAPLVFRDDLTRFVNAERS